MATASKSRLARSNIAVCPVQATTRERHETAKSPREFQGPTPTPVPCGDREHGAAETRHWKESNRHLHANGSTSVSLCASRGGGGLTCPLLGAKTVAVACPRWRGLAQSCLARCLCQNRGGCAEKETRRARAWPQQARADHSPSASDTMLCIEHPLVSARSRTSCQHVPRSLPARARPRGKPWRQHRCDHARLKHQIPSGWPVRREASTELVPPWRLHQDQDRDHLFFLGPCKEEVV